MSGAWSAHWDVADAQLKRLGDNYSRHVIPEKDYNTFRDLVKKQAAKAATRPAGQTGPAI